jgi:hypothetical protein
VYANRARQRGVSHLALEQSESATRAQKCSDFSYLFEEITKQILIFKIKGGKRSPLNYLVLFEKLHATEDIQVTKVNFQVLNVSQT